jgi:Zn finger protein HypA/HybF involved in hydrogenase expression
LTKRLIKVFIFKQFLLLIVFYRVEKIMHEQGLIKKIVEAAKQAGATKKILVEVGELSSITPHHLKEHLKNIVDWEVETTFVPAVVKCTCGFKGKPKILEEGHDFVLFVCPKCEAKPTVLEGGEIKVTGVE